MIHTIEGRAISETRATQQFCNEVQSPERLKLLAVCSTCHLRVVNADAINARLRRRLRFLYEAAMEYFTGGVAQLERFQTRRLRRARNRIEDHLVDWTAQERKRLFDRVNENALRLVEPKVWGRFAPLMRRAEQEGISEAVTVSPQTDGMIEAIVYGADRTGLLTDLAGTIAELGISVESVQAITTADQMIIDIFVLTSIDGSSLDDQGLVRELHNRLLATVRSTVALQPKLTRRLGDRRALFEVEPLVRLDLEASVDCLVVEAVGLDRPGLLFKLARALSEIGVTIRSAHVATYGERAVDTFYLQDAPGYKITNKRRLASIEKRLLNVLAT